MKYVLEKNGTRLRQRRKIDIRLNSRCQCVELATKIEVAFGFLRFFAMRPY